MKLTPDGAICLLSAIYSKALTKADVEAKLIAAPKQLCNTDEAFAGHVMEFVLDGEVNCSVGTLSEYFDHFGKSSFLIRVRESGEFVRVERDEEGNFRVLEYPNL